MNGPFLEKYFKEVSMPRKENCTNKHTKKHKTKQGNTEWVHRIANKF